MPSLRFQSILQHLDRKPELVSNIGGREFINDLEIR
jgi:hypothetical protein